MGLAVRPGLPAARPLILVVDDLPANRVALEALLGTEFSVTSVSCSAEAARALERREFSLILMDVNLPDEDGFQSATRLRQLKNGARTPILFLSAHEPTPERLSKTYASGGLDYVFQPSNPDLLHAKISSLVAMREESRGFARELQAAEGKIHLLLEYMPVAVWTVDPDLCITSCAGAWYSQAGRRPEDYVGHSFLEWQPSTVEGEHRGVTVHRDALSGKQGSYEWQAGDRIFEVHVDPIPGTYGSPVGAVAAAFDTTDLKRARARESFLSEAGRLLATSLDFDQTLKHVAELAVPGIADWCAIELLERDGTVRRVVVHHSDPAKKARAEAFRQRRPVSLLDPHGPGRVLATGEPEITPWIPDLAHQASSWNPEDAALIRDLGLKSVILVPMKARGRTIGVVTLLSAESDRRYEPADVQMAEDLARRAAVALDSARLFCEAQHLAAVVASSDDAILTKDLEGMITSWNQGAERLFGYGCIEIVGKSSEIMIPEELRDREEDLMSRVIRGERVDHFETRRVRKDGATVEVSISISPLRDGSGAIMGVSKIVRDITDRKRAQEEILRLNKELERRVEERTSELQEALAELDGFTGMVSHDLRAPLRTIAGFTSLILDEHGSTLNDSAKQHAARIAATCERMNRLIESLLAYSRIGRAKFVLGPVNLTALTMEVITRMTPEIVDRTVKINVQKPLPVVRGNEIILGQVLENLISNAVKFVRPGKAAEIRIGVDRCGERVRFWVRDNGIGISEEHLNRLFRPFERLPGTREYPGFGLGLAMVKRAVERMGGRIGVDSEPGKGSTFWLDLELA